MLAPLFAALAGASALLDKVIEDEEKKRFGATLRRLARPVLSRPVLGVTAATALLLATTCSSVMVLDEPGRAASLSTLDHEELRPMGDPPRFVVRTGPFGRPYRLAVPGYLPATVTVPPLTGLRVVPARHLEPSPSLLLRPPFVALGSLASCSGEGSERRCGEIRVWTETDGGEIELAQWSGGRRAAFLVGRRRPLPQQIMADWRLELMALGIREEDPQYNQTLLDWKRFEVLEPAAELEPGMEVQARVSSRVGKSKAYVRLTLSDSEFIDVLMEDD